MGVGTVGVVWVVMEEELGVGKSRSRQGLQAKWEQGSWRRGVEGRGGVQQIMHSSDRSPLSSVSESPGTGFCGKEASKVGQSGRFGGVFWA